MNDPAVRPSIPRPRVVPGLTIREARPEDNDALIALELEAPLILGDHQVAFDRRPDFFSRNRLQAECRIVVGEMEGRIVGIEAAAIHSPRLQGQAHRLAYIHHGRIHPSAEGRGVAAALAMSLVEWARERGAEGPYWLIAPGNQRSIRFGGRGGGRWPVEVVFVDYDVSAAAEPVARPAAVPADRVAEAAALVNQTHAGQDLFEPLTAEELQARLGRDSYYPPEHLLALEADGRLLAVAGLWDEGWSTASITRDYASGREERQRSAAVLDWGYAPGCEREFAALLRALAAKARALGRDALTLCQPAPGALPDIGLPSSRWSLALFTPTLPAPPREAIRGLFADLVYL